MLIQEFPKGLEFCPFHAQRILKSCETILAAPQSLSNGSDWRFHAGIKKQILLIGYPVKCPFSSQYESSNASPLFDYPIGAGRGASRPPMVHEKPAELQFGDARFDICSGVR
jgi:hypothetical protein